MWSFSVRAENFNLIKQIEKIDIKQIFSSQAENFSPQTEFPKLFFNNSFHVQNVRLIF